MTKKKKIVPFVVEPENVDKIRDLVNSVEEGNRLEIKDSDVLDDLKKLVDVVTDGDMIALVQEGQELFIEPSAANSIKKFLELFGWMESLYSDLKASLLISARTFDPNFSTLIADDLKCYLRAYGAKYRINEKELGKLDKKFYEEKTTYSVNSKEVDKYLKENGALPFGIETNIRKKSLTLTLKKEKQEDE